MKRNAFLTTANFSLGFFALAFSILVLLIRLFAPDFFWHMVSPIFRTTNTVATDSHFLLSGFENAAALSVNNETLLYENNALASENQALVQKTLGLQELLGSSSTRNEREIVGGVIARPPESPYDTLLISAGSNSGVTDGMEVFGPGDVPIGVVSSTLTDFSRATLFSAPNIVVYGWIGHQNIPITILGSGGGTMSASIARSAGIKVGDSVFAPGPGMLPIGSVVRIDSDPSMPSVALRIRSSVDFFSIGWVLLRDTGTEFTNSLSWATSTLP